MIKINNITVKYRRVDVNPAISSLDLHLRRGEYLSILGPNGSGKSTLIKAICGMIDLAGGDILVDDKQVRPGRFGDDLFGIVAAVFQEPGGQFLMPDVKTEIIAVLQNLGLPRKKQNEIFDAVVSRFSLELLLDSNPQYLSGGQMQIVNLACATAVSPKILLLDEPTTFLDPGYRDRVLDLVDELKNEGMAVIHVTQYPGEALRGDRAVIMSSGSIVVSGVPEKILADEKSLRKYRLTVPSRLVCEQTLGIDLTDSKSIDSFCTTIQFTNDLSGDILAGKSDAGNRLFNAEKLEFSYPDSSFRLDINNLTLYPGVITGIVGPAGSGKSTLAFLLAGLLKPHNGEVRIDGISISEYGLKELRKKIGISWQMPEAVLMGPTVADDMNSIIGNLGLPEADISAVLEKVNLSGFETRIVDSLSGGEKRKVSLAGTLIADPDVVILDEPAAFLDPYSQIELVEIVERLAKTGKAVLVIGHDLPFLAEITDRIIGLKSGNKVFDITAGDFFDDPGYLEMIDLPANPLIYLRRKLAASGLKLPKPSINPRYIAAEINRQSS